MAQPGNPDMDVFQSVRLPLRHVVDVYLFPLLQGPPSRVGPSKRGALLADSQLDRLGKALLRRAKLTLSMA